MRKGLLSWFLCTLALAIGCACGPHAPDPGQPPVRQRDSDSNVDDAVILASREQKDIALDLRLVAQFRRLLRVARTMVPEKVASIHARPDSDYETVGLKVTGDIAAAFDGGNLRTGVAELDALFARFELMNVRVAFRATPNGPSSDQFSWYWLRFKGPIQTARLSDAIKALQIANIAHAEQNNIYGDGDDIRAKRAEAGWIMTFIHGEGDCMAGCTHRTLVRVFVGDDGRALLLNTED